YGHLAPATTEGRIFCMIFAFFGIPLNLMILKSIGDRINDVIHYVHYRIMIVLSGPRDDVTRYYDYLEAIENNNAAGAMTTNYPTASTDPFSTSESLGAGLLPTEQTYPMTSEMQSQQPFMQSTMQPTMESVIQPTMESAIQPTMESAMQPTMESAMQPIVESAMQPTMQPAIQPAIQPATEPAMDPYPEVSPQLQPPFQAQPSTSTYKPRTDVSPASQLSSPAQMQQPAPQPLLAQETSQGTQSRLYKTEQFPRPQSRLISSPSPQ
ncbi:hypothetical protein QZH41_016050, partial [Actinostola sp. cb2023]